MREFNFDNVDEVSGGYSQPGTIAVFTVGEVKFGSTENGKDYMEMVFNETPEMSLTHRFYMSEKAMPRVQSLYKAATGTKLQGNMNEQQLTAAFVGKQVALKVTARIYEGKVYGDLPFGGFCKPVANINELKFTAQEQAEIDNGRNVASMSASASPDAASAGAPTAGAPQATGQVDDF